ncbi:MAG: hypothetical protein NC541_10440 [bacterium]|nr:hypothetical protein [bacterium]
MIRINPAAAATATGSLPWNIFPGADEEPVSAPNPALSERSPALSFLVLSGTPVCAALFERSAVFERRGGSEAPDTPAFSGLSAGFIRFTFIEAPHLLQKRAPSGSEAPHFGQNIVYLPKVLNKVDGVKKKCLYSLSRHCEGINV